MIEPYLDYTEVPLVGKKALITGATSGIGLATAVALAQQGVNLTLVARRRERLTTVAAELVAKFKNTTVDIVEADVTKSNSIDIISKSTDFNFDILVNNAGMSLGLEPAAQANFLDWQQTIDTNVTGAFRMIHAVLPQMVKKQQGHIVNVTSISSHEVYEGGGVYCATKHALLAFSKALRLELCDKNVRVSCVSPGMVNTEFSVVRFRGDKNQADSRYANMEPLLAQDVAHHILFCLRQPPHVNINEIIPMPTVQGSISKVYRKVP